MLYPMNDREIGDALGISTHAVNKIATSALDKLREHMKQNGLTADDVLDLVPTDSGLFQNVPNPQQWDDT